MVRWILDRPGNLAEQYNRGIFAKETARFGTVNSGAVFQWCRGDQVSSNFLTLGVSTMSVTIVNNMIRGGKKSYVADWPVGMFREEDLRNSTFLGTQNPSGSCTITFN